MKGQGMSPIVRGWYAGLMSMAVVLTLHPAAPAQEQPKARSGGPPPSAKAEAPAPDAAAPPAQEAPGAKLPSAALEDRYKDQRAVAALANTFPELFPNARSLATSSADARINAMAAGRQPFDRSIIPGYIQAQIAQLTAHRNIDALLDTSADPRLAKSIEEAGQRLVNPILAAIEAKNATFRTAFTQALLNVAPDVMKNHLYARLMLLLALGRSQEPQALDLLKKQLEDPNQPAAVKHLAAVGISQIAPVMRGNVGEAMRAAKSVQTFLERESGTFWPVEMRALEALGALRQSTANQLNPKPEFTATAMKYLADPEARPIVRAWAATALGMLRPTAKPDDVNFYLMAYNMGLVAAEVGQRIAAMDVDPKNSEKTRQYLEQVRRDTDDLMQLYQGFEGDPALRDAGLLKIDHPAALRQREAISAIATKVKAIITASVALSRSAGELIGRNRAELARTVEGLKAALAQAAPQDYALYPGGPEFRGQATAAASAAERRPASAP